MSQGPDSPFSISKPMHSDAVTPTGSAGTGSAPPPGNVAADSILKNIFLGPNGIRAGWRLLIFAAIVAVLIVAFMVVTRAITRGRPLPGSFVGAAISEAAVFGLVLIASWIMARFEGRMIGNYGLPARGAFGKLFWQGAIIGFVALTVLLVLLRLAGVFSFGSVALHGGEILKNAAGWGVAFLFVGFTEEFALRGYPQFTLTTGMGFWPSAILISFAFGSLHLSNSGEDWIGALSAGSVGLLFCLILRRTGNLWMPVGFHMGWDWAETFFYGVPDSGFVAPGHLMNPTFHGSKWLTGGSVGPEGSVLVFAILVLCWILFHFWLPEVKYPGSPAFSGASR